MDLNTHKNAPLRIYVDASITAHESMGTVGAVFTTHMGRVVGEYSARIDAERTAAYAEFEGILRGVSIANQMNGIDHIKVFNDCNSVIGIFDPSTRFRAKKDEMQVYEERVQAVLDEFEYYTCEYIPREKNPAHAVADDAYERVVGHTMWFDASSERVCEYVDHRVSDFTRGQPTEMAEFRQVGGASD